MTCCCWFGHCKELEVENSGLLTEDWREKWGAEPIVFCTEGRLGLLRRKRPSCMNFVLEPTMSALVGDIAGFPGLLRQSPISTFHTRKGAKDFSCMPNSTEC